MKWLRRLFSLCLRKSEVPEVWKVAYITPFYKEKGAISECSEDKVISMASMMGKVHNKVIIGVAVDYRRTRHFHIQASWRSAYFILAFVIIEMYDRMDRSCMWEVELGRASWED